MNDKLLSGLEAFQVYPIGYIHRKEGEHYLKILPQFRPALKQLEHFSHLTALFWAHEHGSEDARNAIDLQVEPPYAPGKMTGPMEIQEDAHFVDRSYQDAGWHVIARLSGDVDYPASPEMAKQEAVA